MDIYKEEEVFWQKKGGRKWLFEGHANTGYFHGLLHYLFQRDGFSTTFFKEFLDQCKDSLLEMLNVLHKCELDLSRLNYSIITLIRKLRGPQISNKSERFAS